MGILVRFGMKIVLTGLVFVSGIINADVLELKDGSVLKGDYQGGTVATLRFQVNGELKAILVNDILALTFTGGSPASKSGTAPAPAKATTTVASNKGPKTVAAGTRLLIKITQEIGTHNTKQGQIFTATLESKLMAGKVEAVPAGSKVYGVVVTSEKSGIGSRKSVLELTLNKIMIDGKTHVIKTSTLRGEGASGGLGRKILKGAAIGALADGSSGAETGAKVGVGVGILAGGKHAGIKSGTVVEFSLKEALSL